MNPFESFLSVCQLQAMAPLTLGTPFIRIRGYDEGAPFIAYWQKPVSFDAAEPIEYEIGSPEDMGHIHGWPFGNPIELPPVRLEDVGPEYGEELRAKIGAFIDKSLATGGAIRARLVHTNYHTRLACHACGGHTEKVEWLTEVEGGEADGFRICETCIEAGDVPARMLKHADELEDWAKNRAASLRDIAPRLQWPAWAEFVRKEFGLSLAEYQARQRRRQEEMQDVPF